MLNAFLTLSHLILVEILRNIYHYFFPIFLDEETEAQGNEFNLPKSMQPVSGVRVGFNSGLLHTKVCSKPL